MSILVYGHSTTFLFRNSLARLRKLLEIEKSGGEGRRGEERKGKEERGSEWKNLNRSQSRS